MQDPVPEYLPNLFFWAKGLSIICPRKKKRLFKQLLNMNKIIETFQGLTNLQKILVLIILTTAVYGASSSISYSIFSKIVTLSPVSKETAESTLPTSTNALIEDPTQPKTEECPLNGRKHTKKAQEFWEKRRPLAVMVENHTEARPQSGLTSADVVYEAVAEGGITR